MGLLEKYLLEAVSNGASDLHLKVGYKPAVRLHGKLTFLNEPVIDKVSIDLVVKDIFNDKQQTTFYEHKNMDSSLQISDPQGKAHRFRVNAAYDQNGVYVAIRVIPDVIKDIKDIGFPSGDVWQDIINLKRGLVLVTGITGSGKTTTLASLIQEINRTRPEHIITIEDPVEYVHHEIKSVISQRELGNDVESFADGVKYALRQDPDVMLVGEIRDRETAYRALEAAATGHVVFSTLHTTSAAETTRRYVNIFETDDHDNIKNSLAANLSYVLSQQLIPYQKDIGGRTLAMEVLNVHDSAAVKNHIRKGDYHLIENDMQTGKNSKMITMDQHLKVLYDTAKISKEDAILFGYNQEQIKTWLK